MTLQDINETAILQRRREQERRDRERIQAEQRRIEAQKRADSNNTIRQQQKSAVLAQQSAPFATRRTPIPTPTPQREAQPARREAILSPAAQLARARQVKRQREQEGRRADIPSPVVGAAILRPAEMQRFRQTETRQKEIKNLVGELKATFGEAGTINEELLDKKVGRAVSRGITGGEFKRGLVKGLSDKDQKRLQESIIDGLDEVFGGKPTLATRRRTLSAQVEQETRSDFVPRLDKLIGRKATLDFLRDAGWIAQERQLLEKELGRKINLSNPKTDAEKDFSNYLLKIKKHPSQTGRDTGLIILSTAVPIERIIGLTAKAIVRSPVKSKIPANVKRFFKNEAGFTTIGPSTKFTTVRPPKTRPAPRPGKPPERFDPFRELPRVRPKPDRVPLRRLRRKIERPGTPTTKPTLKPSPVLKPRRVVGVPGVFRDPGTGKFVSPTLKVSPALTLSTQKASFRKPQPAPEPRLQAPPKLATRPSDKPGKSRTPKPKGVVFEFPKLKLKGTFGSDDPRFPRVVTVGQGLVRHRVDLQTGEVRAMGVDKPLSPKKSFKVLQFSNRPPRKRTIDLGIIKLVVSGTDVRIKPDTTHRKPRFARRRVL